MMTMKNTPISNGSPHQVHIRIRRKKALCRINQSPILEMDMALVPACDGRLPACSCRMMKTKAMPHWRKLVSAESWTSSTRQGTLPMSSGMWDGADDFGDLEPCSILERSQFTLFTNNLMINDLMINAALQESYCWQSAEG